MANRTVKDAQTIKGTNPQYLVEKIVRTRIYDSKYWKEECFALTAELVVDKAMDLRYVGGTFAGNIKPTPFLCLVLKMLQIQPEKDIVVEFIKNEEYKYVRALGAFYLRLVGTSVEVSNSQSNRNSQSNLMFICSNLSKQCITSLFSVINIWSLFSMTTGRLERKRETEVS